MGAPAVAPRRSPTRAPARQAPPRRKPRANRALASNGARQAPALAGAALIPHAAARTAGAVRDLSDSSLIVRLTAGRGWIAVLCALLGGIVALNVVSLSINATSGRVTQATEEYERQNSALRAELAERLSASRVEAAAANLGLAVPAPEEISYVDARDGDLERLANLLGGDTFLSSDDSSLPSSEAVSYTEVPPVSSSAPASPAPAAPLPGGGAAPAAPAAPPAGGGGAPTGGVGL